MLNVERLDTASPFMELPLVRERDEKVSDFDFDLNAVIKCSVMCSSHKYVYFVKLSLQVFL